MTVGAVILVAMAAGSLVAFAEPGAAGARAAAAADCSSAAPTPGAAPAQASPSATSSAPGSPTATPSAAGSPTATPSATEKPAAAPAPATGTATPAATSTAIPTATSTATSTPTTPASTAAPTPTHSTTADPAEKTTPTPTPTRPAGRSPEGSATDDGPAPTPTDPCHPDEPGGFATSAAAKYNWGTPNRVSDFSDAIDGGWSLYDGPGHVGNGRRSPSAATTQDGVLEITGDPKGTTAGMAWGDGQKYGRWEARVKTPAGDPTYHAVLLLWPDAENWPVGGEVDFMEISDHTRQSTDMFLHYGRDNSQKSGSIDIDATEWHNWAVEWTPKGITAYVDGKEWWKTTDTSILPPGPMHMTIQLDWFPEGGDVKTSKMYVDWVRQYPYREGQNEGVLDRVGAAATQAVGSAVHAVEGAADGAGRALTEGAPDVRPGLVPRAVPATRTP